MSLQASVIGRYAIFDQIAAGGMATVHYGRLLGPVGFSRPVAIKRLHPHLARDPEFVTMFLDEARVAARVRHPNVVATLDIVTTDDDLLLVMEYVQGESLSRLVNRSADRHERMPISVIAAMMAGALHGLHAAHEAKNERGEPLGLVHRDISPQNIIVGMDGVARVLDFGVAKAIGRLQETREGKLKGKLAYIAPELLANEPVTRAADIYAAAVVLWEALTHERLFHGKSEAAILSQILNAPIDPPSKLNAEVPPALDAIVLRGLERDPKKRWPTAREMARAIEAAVPLATASSVGEWVESLAHETLQERAKRVAEIESHSDVFDRSGLASLPSMDVKLPPKLDHVDLTIVEPEKKKPRRWPMMVVRLGAAIALGAVVAWFASRKADVPIIVAPVDNTPTTAATPSASSVPVEPTATIATAKTAPPPATHPVQTVVKKSPPPIKAGCNPPYVVDAQGIKKYKVECL